MRKGEADKVPRQTRRGTVRTDSEGRRWRKARRLSRDAWANALLDAEFDMRFGHVSEETFRALGYEPVE